MGVSELVRVVKVQGSTLGYCTIEDDANNRDFRVYSNGNIQMSLDIGPFHYTNSMNCGEAVAFMEALREAINVALETLAQRTSEADKAV